VPTTLYTLPDPLKTETAIAAGDKDGSHLLTLRRIYAGETRSFRRRFRRWTS
jgi:hypothetical protein